MAVRSLSTANAELEELDEPAAEEPEELEELAPARVAEAPVALDPDPLDELLALEALVVPLAETTSPTCPDSETIVPSWGA